MKKLLLAPLRKAALALGALGLLGSPALATWSICVVDTTTGEVCVATATCIANFNIQTVVPVVVVGRGAGATQALVPFQNNNKVKIYDGFLAGTTPTDILNDIIATDNGIANRQFGIVDLFNAPKSFTGAQALAGKKGVAGTVGNLRYAVQGNILTAGTVVNFVVQTLINQPPGTDLSQRVMAAMETARSLGGDGRCSCPGQGATDCGSPPANFNKSAHNATIILARIGDTDGPCTNIGSCVKGDYFVNLNVIGGVNDIDPVLELQTLYDAWRLSKIGVPDQLLTQVEQSAAALPADGQATASFTIHPFDIDGNPIAMGGASVSVGKVGGGAFFATPGPVTQNPDGSYSFQVTAGASAGLDEYEIVLDDGVRPVTLYPYPSLQVDALDSLHAGFDALPAAEGGSVPFTINAGASAANLPYVLLGSSSGTMPGIPLGGQIVPLNFDPFTDFTLIAAGSATLPGSVGLTDAGGRAEAALSAAPGQFAPGVGLHLDFAAVVLGAPETITNAVGVDVEP